MQTLQCFALRQRIALRRERQANLANPEARLYHETRRALVEVDVKY